MRLFKTVAASPQVASLVALDFTFAYLGGIRCPKSHYL